MKKITKTIAASLIAASLIPLSATQADAAVKLPTPTRAKFSSVERSHFSNGHVKVCGDDIDFIMVHESISCALAEKAVGIAFSKSEGRSVYSKVKMGRSTYTLRSAYWVDYDLWEGYTLIYLKKGNKTYPITSTSQFDGC